MSAVEIGLFITITTFLISIATLVYKLAKVVAIVESNLLRIRELEKTNKDNAPLIQQIIENTKDIEELKGTQKEFKNIITKSLDDIKSVLTSMDKSIGLLAQRMDYLEKRDGIKND